MENADDIILSIRAQFDQARAHVDALQKDLTMLKGGGEQAAGGLTKLEKAVAGTRTTIGSLDKDITVLGRNLGSANDALNAMGINIPVTPMAAFGQVVGAAGRYLADAVNDTVQYSKSILDLAQNLGISTEEMSRIVQVADDYQISTQQIQTALQLAVKNGFAPSIDSLAELADLYVSIQDPVERAAVLTDKFGRNWAQIVPILKNGGDALRAQAAAISDGLIVTEESVRKTEEYRLAVDNLSDAWQGFSMTIGQQVIPGMTALLKLFDQIGNGTANADSAAGFINSVFQGTFLESSSSKQLRAAIEAGKNAPDDGFMGKYGRAAAAAPTYMQYVTPGAVQGNKSFAEARDADAVERVKDKMTDLQLFMAGPVKKENQNYVKIQRELQAELEKTGEEIAALEKQPWRKKELEEAKEKYAGLGEQITTNAEEHKRASKQILFDLAAQRMAQDGLTSAEADAQVQLAKKFGLIDEETAKMWESVKGPVDAMTDGKMTAEEWVKVMQTLSDRWDVTVAWHYEDPPPGGPTGTSGGQQPRRTSKDKTQKQTAAAVGVDFTVPAGYERDSYPVWASSGERVQVTQPGKPGFADGGAGGGITIYGRTTIVTGQTSTNRRAQLKSSRVRG